MMSEDAITICSVGDLMICDSPLYTSVGVGSRYPNIRDRIIKTSKEGLNNADIVIGNFETVVYTPRNKSLKETQMACGESIVADLKEIGFTILNVANNHCLQHGTEGFCNTIKACKKNGITPIGIKDQEAFIIEVKGTRIAFLSLCIHLEWYQPNDILYETSIERILREVKKLRLKDNELLIVVTIHWGDEFAKYPSNAQISLGHRLVQLGANIILGHHSHVFQGVETYHGAVIAYSQGNYISDMVPEMCCQTAILKIEIGKNKVLGFDILPQYIGDDYCLVSTDGNWFQDRQNNLEEALSGAYSNDEYWKSIYRNHKKGHSDFTEFFKRNLFKYKLSISSKMIIDFLGRKLQRILGTSNDGRVSSMDPAILESLQAVEIDD